eukprot:6192756-Pleurochrysis_carterae.AAC.7
MTIRTATIIPRRAAESCDCVSIENGYHDCIFGVAVFAVQVYQIFGPASGAHTAYSCKASSASTRTCDTRPERDPPRKTSFSALTRGLPFREPQGQSHEVRKIGAQATSEGSFCAQAASATNKSRMKGVPLQRSFKAP